MSIQSAKPNSLPKIFNQSIFLPNISFVRQAILYIVQQSSHSGGLFPLLLLHTKKVSVTIGVCFRKQIGY